MKKYYRTFGKHIQLTTHFVLFEIVICFIVIKIITNYKPGIFDNYYNTMLTAVPHFLTILPFMTFFVLLTHCWQYIEFYATVIN